MSNTRNHKPWYSSRVAVLVILILVLAAFVRLYGLFDRGGVLLWDEGAALLEGRFIASGIRAAAWKALGTLPGIPAPSSEDLRAMIGGLVPSNLGKPAHAWLCALSILAVGDHTWAPALMSVVMSLLCIYLVYWFGRRAWGPVVGLTAAFILAISPYFVAYSRLGLAELDFTAISVSIMILLWSLISTDRHTSAWSAVILGLACGVAFTINYRAFIIIALVFAWLIGWCIREKNAGLLIRQAVLFGIACAVPVVMVELMYQAGALVARTVRPGGDFRTYFEQLHWLASAHGTEPPTLENWPTYFYLFGLWEGSAVILLLGGTITALARRKLADWMVLSFFFIPMLQWTVRADCYARLAVLCLPLYALLAGRGVRGILSLRPKRWSRVAVVVVLVAFSLPAVYRDANWMQITTSQRKALSYARERGSVPLIHTSPGTTAMFEDLYSIGQIIRLPEKPHDARGVLEQARKDGCTLVAIDQQKFTTGTQLMHMDKYRKSAAYAIENGCSPIWEIPNQVGNFRLHCFEHNWGFYGTLEIYRRYRDSATMIRMYDIDDALAALP